jgi:hypothetical protein
MSAVRRSVALLLVLIGMTGVAIGQTRTTVRVFHLKHVSATTASIAVQPLLSKDGLLTVQPGQSRLTVQDTPEAVAGIAAAIDKLDREPQPYRIRVELLEGSNIPFSAAATQPDVDAKVRRVYPFHFQSYRQIGVLDCEGTIGDSAMAELGQGYRISFQSSPIGIESEMPWGIPRPGSRIVLDWLRLERLVKGTADAERAIEVFPPRTRVVLSVGQKVCIGAGSSEDSKSGLVLVLTALPAKES